MENKFNDYLMRFNKDKELFTNVSQAYQNKWFQKLNTLPVDVLPKLIVEFRDNKNYYLLKIPLILSKIPVVVRTVTPIL